LQLPPNRHEALAFSNAKCVVAPLEGASDRMRTTATSPSSAILRRDNDQSSQRDGPFLEYSQRIEYRLGLCHRVLNQRPSFSAPVFRAIADNLLQREPHAYANDASHVRPVGHANSRAQ